MTESVAAPAEDWSHEDEFLGHPKGLYVCFTTELWERFSFYGMKFLLLLYLTKYHLFTDEMGFDVLGSYAGLVYALPVIGGLIADRYLGMRKSVLFGGIMLSLGHLLMAVEGHHAINYPAGFTLTESLTLASGEVLAAGTVLSEAITFRDTAALSVFYFALALIVMGVGYLKPNISTIVGKLYAQDDPRRDSGFTIFYMGINIGSFVATMLCGWLGETFGWKYGFGAAGIGMIIGLISFSYGQRYLHGHAEPSDPEKLRQKVFGPISREWSIYLLSLPVLGVLWLLVQHEPVVLAMQNIFLITAIVGIVLFSMVYRKTEGGNGIAYVFALLAILVGIYAVLVNLDHLPVNLPTNAEITEYSVYGAIALIVGFVIYGFLTHSSPEFSRTVVLMFLILTTVVFWALFEQSAGSMTLFFTAAQFGSLNAGFIMLLALPFASLWIWLAKRNLEPTTPVKFGLGIVQAGLGFGALVLGAQFPDAAGKISMIWLILAYLLHTTGELCLSPVGLSAVTKLSIGRVVGVSMGTWFLATALSETVATRLGKMAAVATDGGEVVNSAGALATYTQLFEFLMYVGLGVGIFVLLVSPLLRRGMHGVH
jgi:POT family proton-dependent oligopeptide transporter